MKNLVMDLDGTLTIDDDKVSYEEKKPQFEMIEKLNLYKNMGFKITIFTSRNMKTFQGDTEKIKAHTLPQIVTWLEKNQIPYDELVIGKPWCGEEGFYVDDKAIRPSEFASLEYDEITALLSKENCHNTNKIAGGGD